MKHKNEDHYYADIAAYLASVKMAHTQQHKDFHIVKFEDQMKKIPKSIRSRKLGFFQIVTSYNHDVEMDIDSTKYKGSSEVVAFIAPDQMVSLDIKEIKKGSTGYMIAFSSDFLNNTPSNYSILKTFPYFNMNHPPVYLVDKNQHKFFIDYMEKIYVHFKKLDRDNVEVIRSYMTIMLFEAKRMFANGDVKGVAHSRVEEVTFLFESIITQTKHKRQKLDYYADKLNLSAIYLAECVKKATGKTAKQIISEYLILESKSLLNQSTKTIDDIAQQLGYTDTSNFISFFKKNTGSTPRQFRKL